MDDYTGLVFKCPLDKPDCIDCAMFEIRKGTQKEALMRWFSLPTEQRNRIIKVHQNCMLNKMNCR